MNFIDIFTVALSKKNFGLKKNGKCKLKSIKPEFFFKNLDTLQGREKSS